MTSKRLTVQESGHQSQIESEDTEIDFASLRIGVNKLTISELDADTVSLNGKKLRAASGTDAADFATIGQLGTAESGLQDQIDTHESRLDGIDTLDSTQNGRLTAIETLNSTQNGRLDGIDTLNSTQNGRLDGIDTLNTTQNGRLDDTEADISSLQGDLATIEANNPAFETLLSAGQTVFTATTLTWDASNTVLDIEVYINGRKYDVDASGVTKWKKTSTTALLFSFTVPASAEVTIWKQGTAVVVSGGGGTDLSNIVVDPKPAVNAAVGLGTVTKAWKSVFLKDKATAQVWELEIVNGVLQATAVP